MTTSSIGEVLFLLALGGLAYGIHRLAARYVDPILYEVELGDSGVMLVLARVIRWRIIPYERIVAVREMTSAQFYAEANRVGGGISGVVNRGNPIVVISRDDRQGLFACSPRNRLQFMTDLQRRVVSARPHTHVGGYV